MMSRDEPRCRLWWLMGRGAAASSSADEASAVGGTAPCSCALHLFGHVVCVELGSSFVERRRRTSTPSKRFSSIPQLPNMGSEPVTRNGRRKGILGVPCESMLHCATHAYYPRLCDLPGRQMNVNVNCTRACRLSRVLSRSHVVSHGVRQ